MKILILAAIRCGLMFLLPTAAHAISTQWDLDPISGDWNTPVNWTPDIIPNGPADLASFGRSNITHVSISANTEVDSIIFTPAATNPYTITAIPGLTLTISGTGIRNNSGIPQNFVTAVDDSGTPGKIAFTQRASAGTSIFTNQGSEANFVQGGETDFFDLSTAANGTFINKGGTGFFTGGGITVFHDSSTAGNANFTNRSGIGVSTSATIFVNTSSATNGTFTNEGGGSGGQPFAEGGQTIFYDNSTGANGTFVNKGATVSGGFGGATVFDDSSTAGNGFFINNGGAGSGVAALGGGNTIFLNASNAANGTFINNAANESAGESGVTEFETAFSSNNASPSAGNGTFINNGAIVTGAVGGKTTFYESSTAGAATLIANGGANGGRGGGIFFEDKATGGTARIEVFGDGFVDISGHLGHVGVATGSIEGDGKVFLGANNLTIGTNNLSTTFSGVIHGGGFGTSLTKVGSGKLILSGTNTYSGSTKVRDGVLQVDGSIASNTVVMHLGTLAGTGIIHGDLINHARVSPGSPTGTLTVDNFTQANYADLMIQIANTTELGVLNALGIVNLSGRLDPVLLNGFVPAVGESFTFLTYAGESGRLFIFNRNILNLAEHWDITYFPTYATLTVAAGNVSVSDPGSTFLLLGLGLFALVLSQRQLLRKQR